MHIRCLSRGILVVPTASSMARSVPRSSGSMSKTPTIDGRKASSGDQYKGGFSFKLDTQNCLPIGAVGKAVT